MGHRCRQSTIDGKKHVFEKLILPYFENKPINKITPRDIHYSILSAVKKHRNEESYTFVMRLSDVIILL